MRLRSIPLPAGGCLPGEKGLDSMTEDLLGRIINNQFRVDAYVNFQGSGFVYEVQNLEDDTTLVMRLLSPSYENDAAFYKEVVRKANALSKLSHPNIVPFYGLYRDKEKDFSFSLEKHIEGSSTLDQLLGEKDGPSISAAQKDVLPDKPGKAANKERKIFPLQEALSIVKAISAALGYAHSSGVVHSDIRPENVIISTRGNIYLTGFKITPPFTGAPAQTDPDHQAHTAAEPVIDGGSSPDQDIYAEGVLLFEILTGERLFHQPGDEGENTSAKLARRIRQAQLSIPQTNPRYEIPEIYEELAVVIFKALRVNPAERYRSTKDFYLAICKAVRVFDSEIPDQMWAKIPVTGAATAATITWPRFPRITPATAAIVGAAACVLIIGGLLFFSGLFSLRQSSRILPGYAYVEEGEVTNQVPGGQAKIFQKGASISTGPGALITVGRNPATLLLPGEYRLIIAGDPVTTFELVEETSNQNTHTVVELHQGSLFLLANARSDKNRPVYIQTVSGRATLSGSIMGNIYDNSTQTFSADCVQGQCLLEAEDSVNLISGQRSQVDSSGKPVPPYLMNLSLYSEYNLDFIPTEFLAQNAVPTSAPQNTPTPNPTAAFTPTSIPPTWTPSPTATPVTGYGH